MTAGCRPDSEGRPAVGSVPPGEATRCETGDGVPIARLFTGAIESESSMAIATVGAVREGSSEESEENAATLANLDFMMSKPELRNTALTMFVVLLGMCGLAGFFIMHKAKQAGLDSGLLSSNPAYAMAKMAAPTSSFRTPKISRPSNFVSRTTTSSGTRKMRPTVMAFGRFIELRVAHCARAVTLASRVCRMLPLSNSRRLPVPHYDRPLI